MVTLLIRLRLYAKFLNLLVVEMGEMVQTAILRLLSLPKMQQNQTYIPTPTIKPIPTLQLR